VAPGSSMPAGGDSGGAFRLTADGELLAVAQLDGEELKPEVVLG
jgi:hypothetical protein